MEVITTNHPIPDHVLHKRSFNQLLLNTCFLNMLIIYSKRAQQFYQALDGKEFRNALGLASSQLEGFFYLNYIHYTLLC